MYYRCDRICEACGLKFDCKDSPYYNCLLWSDMTEEEKAEFFITPPFKLRGNED